MSETEAKEIQQVLVNKIIRKASELFLSKGLRSVTLDDIAKELGISKKTIYLNFENKADLILQVVKADMSQKQAEITAICLKSKNAVEEMLMIGHHNSQAIRTYSLNVVHELQRYFPKSWNVVQEYKNTFVLNMLKNNIVEGRHQQLYRTDFDATLTAMLYITYTDSILSYSGKLTGSHPIGDVYYQHVLHHLYAICNENGREILQKNLNKLKV